MTHDMILLNPGPVTLSQRVRNALVRPDICHREPEFADLQAAIRTRLLAVYGLDDNLWTAPVISGSGTAAVEAMLATLGPKSGRVLVIENGVYGERMSEMAAVHGLDYERLALDWGDAVDADTLTARLKAGGIKHVAVVHHETTTGRLNDLTTIGACAKAYGADLWVDAVSSFGAEAIGFHDLPITAVAASANKCLHGAPGAAFVLVRRQALADTSPAAVYLDLARHEQKQRAGGTAFTPAIPVFYALAEGLAEHAEEGGWPARQARYRELAERVAEGLSTAGVSPMIDAQASSCVLRAFYLPQNRSYDAIHDALKQAGFVIYAGQGGLIKSIFRVSPMGAIHDDDVERLLTAIRHTFSD